MSWTQYEFRWLTQAAADTIATDKNSADSMTATWHRMNPAGAFLVRVTERTQGAWAADT